jgi:hypothetical protein
VIAWGTTISSETGEDIRNLHAAKGKNGNLNVVIPVTMEI